MKILNDEWHMAENYFNIAVFEDELKHIVKGKKIGIGRDCDKWIKDTLKNVDPEIETENIETIFDDIRRIKDEYEIDQMTKLGKFTDDAVMYVCKHLKKGMTMFEAERMIVDYGLLNGIQDLSFSPTCGFKTRNTDNAQAIEPFEDERVLEEIVTDYVSIGDFVLTGGELPAMMMVDAISRLVPGVLHNDVSAEFESFQDNLLEYPQYSRPEIWHEKRVPPVLLSGHHVNIEKWRREQSIIRTAKNRPDLLAKAELTEKEKKMLAKLDELC